MFSAQTWVSDSCTWHVTYQWPHKENFLFALGYKCMTFHGQHSAELNVDGGTYLRLYSSSSSLHCLKKNNHQQSSQPITKLQLLILWLLRSSGNKLWAQHWHNL